LTRCGILSSCIEWAYFLWKLLKISVGGVLLFFILYYGGIAAMKISDRTEERSSPPSSQTRVEIHEVIKSMQKGFIEDVKPTWEKWEKEAATSEEDK
jgi:hypothetical protein